MGGLLLVGAAAVWWVRGSYLRPGPAAASIPVVIPHGSPAQVADALQRAGLIDSPRAFVAAAAVTRGEGPLHAGELAFPAHASLAEVLAVLRTGRPVEHRLTIPEGRTAAQIATLLAYADALGGDPVVPDEGAVLPETYIFERGATPAAIVARARMAMGLALAQAWASRDPDLPLHDPGELLILASIVERETAKPEERPHVAAVFLNRLRAGMRLQADPTVAYGVTGGLEERHTLTRADLNWPNPYNTYTAQGLPPAPIDSPGLASIQAVARPASSGDLYFVADGTGGHAFARTLPEHERNVALWRDAVSGAGTAVR